MKRRILRILLVTLLVVLFTGYFAFSTFLFNPLEGSYGADVSVLVPRSVDYFVAKANLAEDFEGFPQLAIADELQATAGGQMLLASEEWQELMRSSGVQEALAELRAGLAQLEVEVELLDVVGGEDLAIAGTFRGHELVDADWVAYARLSWMGKLGVALLPHLDLSGHGMAAAEDGDLLTLSGGQLPRPLHLLRILDVLVVGTSAEHVRTAAQLEERKGEDSLGRSARYHDYIETLNTRAGDEVEFFVDLRALGRTVGWDGDVPQRQGGGVVPSILARFVHASVLNELTGVLAFAGGPRLNVHAELSSEDLTAEQRRMYRLSSFGREEVSELASFAPADAVVFAAGRLHVGDVLTAIRESLEPATRELLDDNARAVWGYADAGPLLVQIASGFKTRVAFVTRENDFVDPTEKAPLSDGRPVYAWALILEIDDESKIDELRTKVTANPRQFGIQSRVPTDSGVYSNQVRGGYVVFEYHHPMVPGTGHLSSVVLGNWFLLSNSHLMLERVLNTYGDTEGRWPRLADESAFRSIVGGEGLLSTSAIVYYNPREGAATLRQIQKERARNEVFIDWNVERPRLEKKIAKEHFPNGIPPTGQAQFDVMVDEEAVRFEQEFKDQHSARLYAKYEREIVYQEMARAMVLQVALDPKRIDLFARALIPLD